MLRAYCTKGARKELHKGSLAAFYNKSNERQFYQLNDTRFCQQWTPWLPGHIFVCSISFIITKGCMQSMLFLNSWKECILQSCPGMCFFYLRTMARASPKAWILFYFFLYILLFEEHIAYFMPNYNMLLLDIYFEWHKNAHISECPEPKCLIVPQARGQNISHTGRKTGMVVFRCRAIVKFNLNQSMCVDIN